MRKLNGKRIISVTMCALMMASMGTTTAMNNVVNVYAEEASAVLEGEEVTLEVSGSLVEGKATQEYNGEVGYTVTEEASVTATIKEETGEGEGTTTVAGLSVEVNELEKKVTVKGTPEKAGNYIVEVKAKKGEKEVSKTVTLTVAEADPVVVETEVTLEVSGSLAEGKATQEYNGEVGYTVTEEANVTATIKEETGEGTTTVAGLSVEVNELEKKVTVKGTPEKAGNYIVEVKAKKGEKEVSKTVTLTISEADPIPVETELELKVNGQFKSGKVDVVYTNDTRVTYDVVEGAEVTATIQSDENEPSNYSNGLSISAIQEEKYILLTGRPGKAGKYIITITAEKAGKTDKKELILMIDEAVTLEVSNSFVDGKLDETYVDQVSCKYGFPEGANATLVAGFVKDGQMTTSLNGLVITLEDKISDAVYNDDGTFAIEGATETVKISGKPQEAGDYTVKIQVKIDDEVKTEKELSFKILPSKVEVEKPEEGKKPEVEKPEEGKKPEVEKPEEGKKPEVTKPEEGKKPEVTKPEEEKKPEVEKPEEGKKPEVEKPEEGKKPEVTKPEEGKKPEVTKPEEGKKPETTNPENNKKPEVTTIPSTSNSGYKGGFISLTTSTNSNIVDTKKEEVKKEDTKKEETQEQNKKEEVKEEKVQELTSTERKQAIKVLKATKVDVDKVLQVGVKGKGTTNINIVLKKGYTVKYFNQTSKLIKIDKKTGKVVALQSGKARVKVNFYKDGKYVGTKYVVIKIKK